MPTLRPAGRRGPDDDPAATGTIEIGAPAAVVYDLVTHLDEMSAVAAETVAMAWVRGERAEPGAVFRGSNRNGLRRWSTTCRVTDATPGRLFAFEVTSLGRIPVARWAYRIEPLGEDRCRVTESTWDHRPGWFKRPAGWATGVADRESGNAVNIATTLAALKSRAEDARPTTA